MRLVVEIEEHAAIVAVFRRQAAPEDGRVIGVRHRDDLRGQVFAGGGPLQLEDHVEARRLEAPDISTHRFAVGAAANRRRDPVDAEPAALVERQPHRVDPPALHRRDRRLVDRPFEDRLPFQALVLAAGAVDAEQANRIAMAIDESLTANADSGARAPVGPLAGENQDPNQSGGKQERCGESPSYMKAPHARRSTTSHCRLPANSTISGSPVQRGAFKRSAVATQ